MVNATCMGGERHAKKMLVRKPDGKRLLGRSKREWGIILKWI
jgi:hypothetical protein